MSNAAQTAAIYARVSSDRQARQQTIASQIAALKQRVREDELLLEPRHCYLDDGYIGSTLIRPALERLRDAAAFGDIDRLYVHSPDRLARNYAYQYLLLEEFARAGVAVCFLNQPPGSTPEEKMLLQMQGMIAEYERAKITERSRRGKLFAARSGKVSALAGAPYGYRYLGKAHGEPQASYHVVLEEARVVQQMFEWVACERASLAEVSRRLAAQGVPTRTGLSRWDHGTVWGILKNPAYCGRAAFGKKRTVERIPAHRQRRGHGEVPRSPYSTIRTSADDHIPIPVPALISDELFHAVQQQLHENRLRKRSQTKHSRYLLQGLLVCGACGYAFCGRRTSRKGARGAKNLYYYRCNGTDRARYGGERPCHNPQVRADRLEEAVWNDVCALLKQPERIHEEYERRWVRTDTASEALPQQLQKRRSSIHRGIERLIDAYTDGLLEKDEFEPRIHQAKTRLQQIDEELNACREQQAEQAELRLTVGELKDFAAQIETGLDNADFPAKQKILRRLIKEIKIQPDDIRITYRVQPTPLHTHNNPNVHCHWRNRAPAARRARAGRSRSR